MLILLLLLLSLSVYADCHGADPWKISVTDQTEHINILYTIVQYNYLEPQHQLMDRGAVSRFQRKKIALKGSTK